jgi:hypothetical protein
MFDVTFDYIESTQHDMTDPVMAEYITIMIINNKTRGKFLNQTTLSFFFDESFPDQISSELEDRAFYTPYSVFYFSHLCF